MITYYTENEKNMIEYQGIDYLKVPQMILDQLACENPLGGPNSFELLILSLSL